jgi:signal transduction histidine kinase
MRGVVAAYGDRVSTAADLPVPGDTPALTLRGLVGRRPLVIDAALAVVAFVTSVLVSARTGQDPAFRPLGDLPTGAYPLFAVAAAALLARRQRPVAVLAVVLTCSGLAMAADYGEVAVASVLALYGLGRYTSSWFWTVCGLGATMTLGVIDVSTSAATLGDAIAGAFVTVLIWYVGRRVRQRGERAELLEREQAAQAGRVLAEERARIARELHDVVAHGVSLMTVQAGAAKTVASADPQAAAQAMAAVELAGREALGQLRDLLAVLRPDRAREELGPQPGLADVPRLLDQFREAGLQVSLELDPAPGGLPARVDLFAFRILQEAMTNVLKHGGPGTAAEVRIRLDGRAVTVDVADDGHSTTGLPGSGHGLVGMRERAQLLGGSLQAGPRPGGGFHVHAVLPIDEESP